MSKRPLASIPPLLCACAAVTVVATIMMPITNDPKRPIDPPELRASARGAIYISGKEFPGGKLWATSGPEPISGYLSVKQCVGDFSPGRVSVTLVTEMAVGRQIVTA